MNYKKSYSQCGEDVIIEFLLRDVLHYSSISYVDIGVHHPIVLNNTYLLYDTFEVRCGVLVEPNPSMAGLITSTRSKDHFENIGIYCGGGDLTYYRMDVDTLNTFSEISALDYVKKGHAIVGKDEIKTVDINELFCKYFCSDSRINVLSIDVEGVDVEIIQSIDYEKWTPERMCVETIEYLGAKRGDFQALVSFLESKGYIVFADTYINTIFVKQTSLNWLN